jgi:hypothetical protein
MTALLLALALAAAPLGALSRSWWGDLGPDPAVLVAAACALLLKPRQLALAALALGWSRALVLGEPAGGQVLCALAALSVGWRLGPGAPGSRPWLLTSLAVAGTWWLVAQVLALVLGLLSGALVAPAAGPGLFLAAALALPSPVLASWRARRARDQVFAS